MTEIFHLGIAISQSNVNYFWQNIGKSNRKRKPKLILKAKIMDPLIPFHTFRRRKKYSSYL